MTATDLAEQLGAGPLDKLVLLTADDLGLSHASNCGVQRAVREGMATGASLVVPGPWARHAVDQHRGEPVGVLITLTAEFDHYRWGPVSASPSLLGGDGGFPRTVVDFWDHADLDEARRECRIQIERAILWGFDVTHLASRAGALTHRPEFFDLLTELCLEFSLPVRLPNADDEAGIGFPLRQLARDDALVSPDRVVRLSELDPAAISDAVDNLAPGVTELVLRPAIDSPELVAIDPDSAMRIRDLDAASPWSELAESLSRAGCRRLSWRDLRAVARPS